MALPNLLLGIGLTGFSALTSLLTKGEAGDDAIMEAASEDIQGAYDKVADDYVKSFNNAFQEAMALYPQYRDEIANAYSPENNPALKDLLSDLGKQKEMLIGEMDKQAAKGSNALKSYIARIGVTGARSASQYRQLQGEQQEQKTKALLGQDIARNQILANLASQSGAAQAGLAGQFGTMGAGAKLGVPGTVANIQSQGAGAIANLLGSKAIAETSEPSELEQLLGITGQIGGSLIGSEITGKRGEQTDIFKDFDIEKLKRGETPVGG